LSEVLDVWNVADKFLEPDEVLDVEDEVPDMEDLVLLLDSLMSRTRSRSRSSMT